MLKARWADPEARARIEAHLAAARQANMADPEKRAAMSKRSSEWMTSLHRDPDFQARRNERSSRVAKATWADPEMRAHLTQKAHENHERMLEGGTGLWSPEAKKKKAAANRWILTQANAEMHADTEYNEKYKAVQARLRLEMPYDGPTDEAFYMEYLGKLGRAVVADPELRQITTDYMREAIPRWAAKWREGRGDK